MRLRAVLLAAVLTLTIAPPATAAPSMFTLSDPSARLTAPASIAAAPDGHMWIANAGPLGHTKGARYAVGRVDLGGRYRLFRTSGETYGIAALRDGSVFATEPYTSRIARIGSDGRVTEFPTPTRGAQPGSIAAGPDGSAWFTEAAIGGGASIGRITPDGRITEFPVARLAYGDTSVAADLGTIVAAGDRLWFTTGLGAGSITTDGQVTTLALPEPASPYGIAPSSDGTLWVTESALPRIDRIAPDGSVDSLTLPDTSDGVSIAAGPAGAMYFAQALGHTLWLGAGSLLAPIDLELVDRVRHGTGKVQPLSVAENGGAPGIAAGPADTLWIAAALTRKGGTAGGVAVVNLGGSCIVPGLAGERLSDARQDLANHACALGAATVAPRKRVVCQQPAPGTVLGPGALVDVTSIAACRR